MVFETASPPCSSEHTRSVSARTDLAQPSSPTAAIVSCVSAERRSASMLAAVSGSGASTGHGAGHGSCMCCGCRIQRGGSVVVWALRNGRILAQRILQNACRQRGAMRRRRVDHSTMRMQQRGRGRLKRRISASCTAHRAPSHTLAECARLRPRQTQEVRAIFPHFHRANSIECCPNSQAATRPCCQCMWQSEASAPPACSAEAESQPCMNTGDG